MAIETTKYIRKPLIVEAVQITNENFDEIVEWCKGEVVHEDGPAKRYIKVRVHNPKNVRQTQAYVKDWLLYTEKGYKVYTNKAFHASFDLYKEVLDNTPTYIPTPEAGQTVDNTEGIPPHGPVTVQSVGPVAAEPGNGVGEIVDARLQTETTNEGKIKHEPVVKGQTKGYVFRDAETGEFVDEEYAQANPSTTVRETIDEPENVEQVPEQEKVEPAAVEGKRVLSIPEQQRMSQDEIRELIRSGEAVLAQDIAQP